MNRNIHKWTNLIQFVMGGFVGALYMKLNNLSDKQTAPKPSPVQLQKKEQTPSFVQNQARTIVATISPPVSMRDISDIAQQKVAGPLIL